MIMNNFLFEKIWIYQKELIICEKVIVALKNRIGDSIEL